MFYKECTRKFVILQCFLLSYFSRKTYTLSSRKELLLKQNKVVSKFWFYNNREYRKGEIFFKEILNSFQRSNTTFLPRSIAKPLKAAMLVTTEYTKNKIHSQKIKIN